MGWSIAFCHPQFVFLTAQTGGSVSGWRSGLAEVIHGGKWDGLAPYPVSPVFPGATHGNKSQFLTSNGTKAKKMDGRYEQLDFEIPLHIRRIMSDDFRSRCMSNETQLPPVTGVGRKFGDDWLKKKRGGAVIILLLDPSLSCGLGGVRVLGWGSRGD